MVWCGTDDKTFLCRGCDWEDEQQCFDTLLKEVAAFCAIPANPLVEDSSSPMQDDDDNNNNNNNNKPDKVTEVLRNVEQIVLPAMRNFLPPKELCNNGAVVQIACLEGLYKIFERC